MLSFPEGMKGSLTRILLVQLPVEIAGRRGAVTALSALTEQMHSVRWQAETVTLKHTHLQSSAGTDHSLLAQPPEHYRETSRPQEVQS